MPIFIEQFNGLKQAAERKKQENIHVVAIIQARMGSERLPGKVLKEVCGEPLLARLVRRLGGATLIDNIVVATTDRPEDDAIAELGKKSGFPVFRGDSQDVLGRFERCADFFDADIVVRICGDCPIIDPAITDVVIATLINSGKDNACSTVDLDSLPRGLDGEAVWRKNLKEAAEQATSPYEREHVTPYLYHRPDRFEVLKVGTESGGLNTYRWCVDETDDFDLLSRVIENLEPEDRNFGWRQVVQAMQENPTWQEINAQVRQKTGPAPEASDG